MRHSRDWPRADERPVAGSTADGVVQADTCSCARTAIPTHCGQGSRENSCRSIACKSHRSPCRTRFAPRSCRAATSFPIHSAFSFFRLDDEGRLVMGGRGSLGETNGIRPSFCRRRGVSAVSADRDADLAIPLGRKGRAHGGSHAACRVCARLADLCRLQRPRRRDGDRDGSELGKWVRTGDTDAMPLPPSPMRPLPFHGFRHPVLEGITAYYRLRDRLSWRGSTGATP